MVPEQGRYNACMQRVAALLLAAVVCSCGADTVAPETRLLQRVRYHMGQMLTNLPNYTCLQTIERTQRAAPNKKPTLTDIVRIEVALVEGKELFAWPGTGKFTDTEINQMVKGGAIGTGSFGLHARAIFIGSSATHKYEGQEQRNGRTVHKWSFVVPQHRSGYHLRDGINEAIVGYSGAFWVDAATLDAVRLEVRADGIPDFLRVLATEDAVEYARVRIGESDFLLPARAELHMTDRGHSENINRTTFSRCRQYSGESRLILEDPDPVNETKPPEPERVMDAPAGLVLDLALQSDIVIATAAVGDPVTAVLRNPLKLGTGVVIPKGALVHGRIMQVRRGTLARYAAIAVGIRLLEIESPGWRIRIAATLNNILTPSLDYLNARWPGFANPEGETISGSFIFVKESVQLIRRGLRMNWLTRPIRNEDQQ